MFAYEEILSLQGVGDTIKKWYFAARMFANPCVSTLIVYNSQIAKFSTQSVVEREGC